MLELILVVTIMGALAALSLGKSSKILAGWRVTRAAQAFSEELQQAFAIVGRNRRPVVIEFKTDSMTLYIKGRSGTVYRRRHFGKDSEYHLLSTDMDFSRLTLEVYPPGLAADSLSVVMARPGTSRRVRMLRGGLVQICSSGAKNKCD